MLMLGNNVVATMKLIVQYDFSNWELGATWVASQVTEPGSSLTEPGAVTKFSDFSSHPGAGML